jgi:UDP-glucose 4-epimerase
MEKVLITGGSGFLGFHLATELSKKFNVDIIDNFSRGRFDKDLKHLLKKKNVNLIKLDLKNKIKLKGRSYNYIFHFAATIGVANVINNPWEVLNNNFLSTKNIIEIAKKQKSLKKFFFASTSEIYAGALSAGLLKFPTQENQLIALKKFDSSRSTYMLSKIYGEVMCLFSKLPYIIIRPHNIFGERMGMSHVIPEIIKKILKKKKSIKVSNQDHKRTFCYIKDAVNLIIILMKNKKLINKTYNLADSRKEIKILDLANTLIKISKKKLIVKKFIDKNQSPKRRLANTSKILKDTKYRFNSSFKDNLKKTFDWYEKNISI